MQYVVSKIALKRRSELVEPPDKLDIHESFLAALEAEEFSSAFRAVHSFFYELLSDIAKDPVRFGLPSLETEQMRGGPEGSEALIAAGWPFYLLLYLFACGKVADGVFTVDVPSFRRANKGRKTVKHCENYLKIFSEYGFVFEGLKNHRIPNNAAAFTIAFPDMPAVVSVLHLVAEKCYKYLEPDGFALFSSWNTRLITQARDVMRLGAVGPVLRASGVARDIRRDDPAGIYGELDFRVATDGHADVYGRTVVRVKELLESYKMIRQILRQMPDGPISVRVPNRIPAGEAVSRYEAPRGEDLHYIRSNGTDKPERVKVRAPTLANLAAITHMIDGGYLADVPIIIAAIDPCFSCTDRMVRVKDASSGRDDLWNWDQLHQYSIDWYRGRGVDLSCACREAE